ncbi:MAG: GerMN domain-containing protein [Bacillota bacterium]
MADKKYKLKNPSKKRKILMLLRIALITAGVIYLLIFLSGLFVEEKVDIYFSTADAMYLQSEKREVSGDDIYQEIAAELNRGPEEKNLSKTIPDEVELLDYQLEDGLLILNYNKALVENHWGGSTGETMTVYSIVNSYTSLENVDQVKILIEDKEIETLAGHMDLTASFEFNDSLVLQK